ncbi:hypothetical protein KKD19_02110 [Patescibacteria group bacterium]|nr:hypothetical protein [Patescibacteria group bacterium]MBU4512019.1 hypothetical protein [Patescibacteria group bacterium]MCG2693204.1 hypothetical protein [Candidatus Parcubacteria bacterium]
MAEPRYITVCRKDGRPLHFELNSLRLDRQQGYVFLNDGKVNLDPERVVTVHAYLFSPSLRTRCYSGELEQVGQEEVLSARDGVI